jgi:hypothetical protein
VFQDVAVIEVKAGVILELHENLDSLAGQDQHNLLESLARRAPTYLLVLENPGVRRRDDRQRCCNPSLLRLLNLA